MGDEASVGGGGLGRQASFAEGGEDGDVGAEILAEGAVSASGERKDFPEALITLMAWRGSRTVAGAV